MDKNKIMRTGSTPADFFHNLVNDFTTDWLLLETKYWSTSAFPQFFLRKTLG